MLKTVAEAFSVEEIKEINQSPEQIKQRSLFPVEPLRFRETTKTGHEINPSILLT